MNSYSLFCQAIFLTATIAQASGQAPVQFDAATVKINQRNNPGDRRMRGGPGTNSPGRVVWQKAWLEELLMTAFDVDPARMSGPEWMHGMDAPLYSFNAVMPPDTTQADFQRMMQGFLIEQFKITLHHEPKLFGAYDLVVAPGGPKLKLSADPNAPDIGAMFAPKIDPDGFSILPPGHGVGFNGIRGHHATFQNVTMAELADRLSGLVSPPRGGVSYVRDKTGLTGQYDFKLKFEGDAGTVVVGAGVQAAQGTRDALEPGSNLPGIFKAVQQQLGLQLVKVKDIPLDSIVIDHAEKIPVGN